MATDEGMNPGDEYTGSIYDTDDDTENCPRCGKPLEIRGGRHGDFIGCTGYQSVNIPVHMRWLNETQLRLICWR